MSNFFIDRPIFAWVIAILVMLGGGLAITQLPIEQYPEIAPPGVSIRAVYPGASAKTVENTVVQTIEQNLTGLDNLLYFSSTADSAGIAEIQLSFLAGTNPDIAQVQVQNKLQAALPMLPQAVQQQGIRVTKAATGVMMVVAFVSPDSSMDRYDLSDYAFANIMEPLSRVNGVGEVELFGSQYSMRIWLDANKLNGYSLTPEDVSAAIRAENVQVSAGEFGGGPSLPGQQLNATIVAQTLLRTPEQFEQVLLRVNPDGSQVRLGDVAQVNLGGEFYMFDSYFNRKPASGLVVRQAVGANALETARAVKAKLKELSAFFPPGITYDLGYDTTPFVEVSIAEVVETLLIAIVLVFLVMYLFLQNFRATLIPTIAVPVVVLGTFGVLAAAGFSINTLTMFGMVLAIGLLVDDAIVVVENVERLMAEEGLSPKAATRKSMGQIQGALVGIGVVLSAVFIPMAFFPGTTGGIYRQFSITIASAMILSVLVALILTPALCATLLKPLTPGHHHGKRGFYGWFNRGFTRLSEVYQGIVARMLGKTPRYLVVYGLIIVGVGVLFARLPTGFLPNDDVALMFAQLQLPAGATLERTLEVMHEVEDYLLDKEKDTVASVYTVTGYSFSGRGQNNAQAFIKMRDWSERADPALSVQAVAQRAMAAFSQIKGGIAFAFSPPAIRALGNSTGFDLQLKDNVGLGHDALTAARDQLLGLAAKDPRLTKVRPNGINDSPQYQLDIDREKAGALGVSLADINTTLSTAWGALYVNDFLHDGRIKKVLLQGAAPYRMLPEDLNRWYVRNSRGEMVPFAAFAAGHWVLGPSRLERYNGVPSMEILGEAAAGYSSGDAMAAMTELVKQLPPGIGYEWTKMSLEESQSGSQAPLLYALSLLVVFLCLAALYESWSIPFAVMLVVPLGVIGALLATYARGLPNDIFFQVGVLTTIGLSTKNAILIVEFAKDLHAQDVGVVEATVEGVRLRLRPIVMTSLAFMMGVLPLVTASGAGAASQNGIGTGVLGGMLTATVLAIFFVPLFFVAVRRVFSGRAAIDRENRN